MSILPVQRREHEAYMEFCFSEEQNCWWSLHELVGSRSGISQYDVLYRTVQAVVKNTDIRYQNCVLLMMSFNEGNFCIHRVFIIPRSSPLSRLHFFTSSPQVLALEPGDDVVIEPAKLQNISKKYHGRIACSKLTQSTKISWMDCLCSKVISKCFMIARHLWHFNPDSFNRMCIKNLVCATCTACCALQLTYTKFFLFLLYTKG